MMSTTAIAFFYLVISFGDFPATMTQSSGTMFAVQVNRYGPMTQDECVRTASAMMSGSPKIKASCTDGAGRLIATGPAR
jgi:hypothetical protein